MVTEAETGEGVLRRLTYWDFRKLTCLQHLEAGMESELPLSHTAFEGCSHRALLSLLEPPFQQQLTFALRSPGPFAPPPFISVDWATEETQDLTDPGPVFSL